MAPKAVAPKAVEPPAKKAKTEEAPEQVSVEEDAPELEKSAPDDKRQRLADEVTFPPNDCTLNVVPTSGGSVLMGLTDGGTQFLMAGARASVGVKKGRYMFEVKVLETLWRHEPGYAGRTPQPKQTVRVGFSAAGSSLVLGDVADGANSASFDSEGFFVANGKKLMTSQRFTKGQVVGVLLNLDAKSPNSNTVSLFRDGQRISKPQALPEELKDKALFPHVSFRGMSVQVNFGPSPLQTLPFTCRTIQDAAKADTELSKVLAKDKCTVVFPVAVPDEATFDFVDGFLKQNPQYTELSDRKIQEWATKSGFWKPTRRSLAHSNDKPEFGFGVQGMDDGSVSRVTGSVAPLLPRDYVFMEVKQNLVAEDRRANLKKFSGHRFKRVAHVVMGKPSKEFVAGVHKAMLASKQARLNAEHQAKKLERERKKRQAAAAEVAKKALEEKKKQVLEEADGEVKKEEGASAEKEEEEKEEAKEESKEEAQEEVKKEDDEEVAEEPPVAELTDEEKAACFKPVITSDLSSSVLAQSFAGFSIPEKSEGFDEIRFEWAGEAEAKQHLKSFVLKLKVSTRVDDLAPNEWFKTTSAEFEKRVAELKQKAKISPKFVAPPKEGEEAEKKEPIEDIAEISDVCDVGDGTPLFKDFGFEDWALLGLRCDLYLLSHMYSKVLDDPERPGIHESNLPFYPIMPSSSRSSLPRKCTGKKR
ncbi:unnamed protein product [Prorocentrum cordatum]|uniref:B30.2/SPRY domain-containing protein n=1 Tax=Prorocentrum cordatum TaxID=2364126 RepID=A0ABN9SCY6_9DINO|nr:unnamed protein product [Polarella glacialis]